MLRNKIFKIQVLIPDLPVIKYMIPGQLSRKEENFHLKRYRHPNFFLILAVLILHCGTWPSLAGHASVADHGPYSTWAP